MSQPGSAESTAPPHRSLHLFRSFRYIFENPHWVQTTLFIAIWQFIPVLGSLVTGGYQFEVSESLLHSPHSGSYPDFDFNKFGQYMRRGFWPFLVLLIVWLVLSLILILVGVGGMYLLLLVDPLNPNAESILKTGITVLGLLMMLICIAVNVVSVPMTLRAGYMQSIWHAFNPKFARDFMQRTWKETVVALWFQSLTFVPLLLAGSLICGIGLYFALALWIMSQTHLIEYQLYSLYLSRGGEPIPVRQAS
jgi:amino acid transporter